MCVGREGGKDENVLGWLLVRTKLQNGREGEWRGSGGRVEGEWRESGGRVEGEWRESGGGVEGENGRHANCVGSFLG